MSYLVDTNVLSELTRPNPAPSVVAWFEEVGDEALHLSVLTLGELRRGVEKLPSGKRREKLRSWLEHELPAWFGERLLPIDAAVADAWGRLQATSGRTLPAVDTARRDGAASPLAIGHAKYRGLRRPRTGDDQPVVGRS